MQDYVRNGIVIINQVTKELCSLNNLSIYLAKKTNINALKCLKLIIIASTTKKLAKPINFNGICEYNLNNQKISGTYFQKKENLISNLALNPQNYALEIMENLLNNYPINLYFLCQKNKTFLDLWYNSFEKMSYDETDPFYKRFDMLDKKIDIIEFLFQNNRLDINQINKLLSVLEVCLSCKNNFTECQLVRINLLVKKIRIFLKYYYEDASDIKKITGVNTSHHLFKERLRNAKKELENFEINEEQCLFMLESLPKIIKKVY